MLGSIPSVRNFSFAASSAYCQPTPEEVPYETKDIVMMWDKTCHIGIYFISVFWLPYLCKGKYEKSFPKVLCHPEVFSNNDINVTCFWTSALKYLEGYAKACNMHLITVQKKLFSKKKLKLLAFLGLCLYCMIDFKIKPNFKTMKFKEHLLCPHSTQHN